MASRFANPVNGYFLRPNICPDERAGRCPAAGSFARSRFDVNGLVRQNRRIKRPSSRLRSGCDRGRRQKRAEFEEDFKRVLHKARGDEPVVRIFPILAARQPASVNQSVEK